MRNSLVALSMLGLLAACAQQPQQAVDAGSTPTSPAVPAHVSPIPQPALPGREPAAFAALPDRGELVRYDRSRPVLERSAYTWHPVELSEAHALRAVVSGEMVVAAPNGRPIRLQHVRHVEHADGNWTWVGREAGAAPGTEAIITFGARAVFGSIPDGAGPPLRLTSAAGRAWLVATDPLALARLDSRAAHPRKPDFRLPPRLSLPASAVTPAAAPVATAAGSTGATATSAGTTIDLLLGYTSGFATGLGGQSQALTRLNHLVAVANQAYVNSQVDLRVRLVHAAQVAYADNTSNEDALYDLTGVECTAQTNGSLSCTYVGPVAALQPLHAARNQYGADLISLVRDFHEPENEGCGLAWINGGGQVALTAADEITGLSVVSDGTDPVGDGSGSVYYCRDETLVHEIGHNMGSAHDRDTADGDDNVLQSNEYGRYPYSFGYKTAANNFYTVMAYGDDGQTPYRVFSNPAITSCGGQACGVQDQADNARSLRLTMGIVSQFRATVVGEPRAPRADFNGDGRSDVLWRHSTTGSNALWLSASSASAQALARVTNLAWRMVGVGDFNADGQADILWRNMSSGANTIWRSGNATDAQSVAGVTSQSWQVAGVGDFNGDGLDDILWRNYSNGQNVIWRSGNKATPQAVNAIGDLNWIVAGVGDFNGDGRADIVWRNRSTGANLAWWSASYATRQALATVGSQAWQVAGVGDFNGDGNDDLLWRNRSSGANTIWRSAQSATSQAVSGVADQNWKVEAVANYDGDGVDDILWRNASTGANVIWRGARSSTPQAMAKAHPAWQIQP